jgi:YYY domain-containing protein
MNESDLHPPGEKSIFMSDEATTTHASRNKSRRDLVLDMLLLLVLLAGIYLRVTGLFWGEYQYLHPDERFLVWVGTDIQPVNSLSAYFDTANSTLNPHNAGHGFYVYGTLPMFLARYVVEWIYGHSGFMEMTNVGRSLSTLVDLLTVFLVYLTAARLYDKRVAILAAAFSAAAVLQIQQSHFFTMDTFINFFSFLAFYFAVRVMASRRAWVGTKSIEGERAGKPITSTGPIAWLKNFVSDPLFLPSLGFGVALGMAVASKLNAVMMAVALPAAIGIGLLNLPAEQRARRAWQALGHLVLAAVISFWVFRIFQPYAFSGPGILGIAPNPNWVNNIRELLAQSNGEVDFPPAMQWARRPVWFSFQNLVLWGLGLPLGILAWSGFLWVGWRMFRIPGEWRRHALIWGWTGIYFAWQSMALNPTMRYQLPIYPTLAIFAGWALVALYDLGRQANREARYPRWSQAAAVLLGLLALAATYGYAFAFTRIYERQITRIEASRWIYQNIPGPITLPIQTPDGLYNQPLPFPYTMTIASGVPYATNFVPKASGTLSEVHLPRVREENGEHQVRQLALTISDSAGDPQPLASATLVDDLTPGDEARGKSYTLQLDRPVELEKDRSYALRLELLGEPSVTFFDGDVTLGFQTTTEGEGWVEQEVEAPPSVVPPNTPYSLEFVSPTDGYLAAISITDVSQQDGSAQPYSLQLVQTSPGENPESQASDLYVEEHPEGNGYLISLEQPLSVVQGERYLLLLDLQPESGLISLSGLGVASEGDWDDGLPLRLDGYDGYGGIYPHDLTFNMYWDDNPDKLARFLRILDESDYLTISSSRQWGSLPRLPERFPMTTVYYRELLGCPPTWENEKCYNIAEPGTFQGRLGFDLVATFQSDPTLGPLRINDQPSEEAFTVYDHPKVFIFKKRADYNPGQVAQTLGLVDFSHIVRVKPMLAAPHPENLLLPDHRLAEQRQNGTWSELFDTDRLINRFQPLTVLAWYLSVALLGLLAYPLLRLALPGLADRGYPMARLAGLLLLSYLVWIAGALRVPFERPTITLTLILIALAGALAAYYQRRALRSELRERRTYYLLVESLYLALFLAFLLVRFGNPDLWHPWKGGEKPMDFSYFNAVLKSSSFPPYDPWYAAGYLNYYYYGFLMVGVLVKWLGIVPSVAYNLILPTLFAMIAMGAFSLAWNLYLGGSARRVRPGGAWAPALAGALGMAVLGNLGSVRMIFQGYQRLAAPGGVIEDASLLTRWVWAFQGFMEVLKGARLPYALGDWYWIPSRAIPAPGDIEPITEFPYFTVLYADLHAHLMALPITLLALAFPLSIVLGRGRLRSLAGGLAGFVLGGLAIGALLPTNTWDLPLYLALGVIAVVYALWRNYKSPAPGVTLSPPIHPALFKGLVALGGLAVLAGAAWVLKSIPGLLMDTLVKMMNGQASNGYLLALTLVLTAVPLGMVAWNHTHSDKRPRGLYFLEGFNPRLQRLLLTIGGATLLAALAFVLYRPFAQWYALGYTEVAIWKGTHTPPSAYFTHWGLFLFVIVTWMAWESHEWMARTPLSALRKLLPYRYILLGLLILLLFAILAFWVLLEVRIAWIVLPLGAWAVVLLLQPGLNDARRVVLFLTGTALTLTLFVEVVVLRGDIGRMNTVFKFYLQAWTLSALCAAAALGWLLDAVRRWSPGWRGAWTAVLALLVFGAGLYPLLASAAKIKDRMAPEAPHTLDGMAYMPYASYSDEWGTMELSQDYQAIRWLQEKVSGSPVIVEANLRALYRWGSRMSIYTGLPGVVGWEWHQQQQRGVFNSALVSQRIAEVDNFYQTTDWNEAVDFLHKYDVQYIIVGQQERGHYPGPGLEKFEAAEGILWRELFRHEDTVIYIVMP